MFRAEKRPPRMDADEIVRISTILALHQIFITQLGWDQSWSLFTPKFESSRKILRSTSRKTPLVAALNRGCGYDLGGDPDRCSDIWELVSIIAYRLGNGSRLHHLGDKAR